MCRWVPTLFTFWDLPWRMARKEPALGSMNGGGLFSCPLLWGASLWVPAVEGGRRWALHPLLCPGSLWMLPFSLVSTLHPQPPANSNMPPKSICVSLLKACLSAKVPAASGWGITGLGWGGEAALGKEIRSVWQGWGPGLLTTL